MKKPHIQHMGVIVADLKESLGLFETLFGLDPVEISEIPDAGLRVARLEAANIDIELIEYTEDEAFGKKVMGAAKGINHLAVRVDDMESALENARQKGIAIQSGFPREGSRGKVAFFETNSTQGILLEICEH
jgi:methylmalonyl-CoA epimerase